MGEQAIQKVEIVRNPSVTQRVTEAIGPYLEVVGTGAFVLILVLFMLMQREDLRDRIVKLFGSRNVSHTTKLMDEVGGRISRYLGMLSIVNMGIGVVVGLGLALIGVEYFVLWGFLAGALRFIPYVGPGLAFAMPLVFSIADTTTWTQPLMVLALFAVMEGAANTVVEPVIYGKTTGISALGLLAAALFWTWLWGPMGLLLSTPLTVSLAMLGKSVPALGAFWTLLGEETDLAPEIRFYQRVLADDPEDAIELVESLEKEQTRIQIYDGLFLPALSLAERDQAAGLIDEAQRERLWRTTWDLIEEMESTPRAVDESPRAAGPLKVVGIAAGDSADSLALRMLGRLLTGSGVELEILESGGTPLELTERIVTIAPELVLLSHVMPAGLTSARYLVRRLHSRLPSLPVIVGLWGAGENVSATAAKFTELGAQKVVGTLGDVRAALMSAHPAESKLASLRLARAGPGARVVADDELIARSRRLPDKPADR